MALVATGKWQDYQNLPNMRQYDRQTIEAVVKKLTSVANQRLSKLEQAGLINSPSYRNVSDEYLKSRFPTNLKNMSRQDLLKQYSRLNWFLDNKTSTVTGAKQVIADFSKRIGATLTKTQTETFWTIYDRLKELSQLQTELYYLDSEQVMKETADIVTNPDLQNPPKELIDEMLTEMQNRIQTLYAKKMNIKQKQLEQEFVTDEDRLQQFMRYRGSLT